MTTIIGIDPGPVTGVCLLRTPSPAGRPDAWYGELAQVTPNGLWALVAVWVDAYDVRAIAAEVFVVSHLASRVNDRKASQTTRDILGQLKITLPAQVRRIERTAAEVKPWATDRRLIAAGLHLGKGMPHAHDAARHALFAACSEYGARDPLSRRVAVPV